MAPLLLGWLLLNQRRPFSAAILLGLAMVANKGMWPFAILLTAGHITSVRSTSSLLSGGMMALPASILRFLGALHLDSALWLFTSNIGFEIQSTISLPVLDGVVDGILFGGVSGIGKGVIVLGVALLALGVIKRAWELPGDQRSQVA